MREPARLCVGCRTSLPKRDLIRLVKGEDGYPVIDAKSRMDGRGAYICANEACIEAARKKHGIDRALRCSTPDSIYEALKGFIHEQT